MSRALQARSRKIACFKPNLLVVYYLFDELTIVVELGLEFCVFITDFSRALVDLDFNSLKSEKLALILNDASSRKVFKASDWLLST